MERPVSFESGGLRLIGVLGCPDGARARRGVVLIHGWGGYRIGPNRILVQAARAFNEAGATTLRFDLRGRGDSEGDAAETDLDMMIDDTCRAVEFLKGETNLEDVTLLGICSGANVAVGAATLVPDIRDLILWSIVTFQPERSRSADVARTGHFALGYARKLLRPTTWRKFFSGRVNFRMVWRVLFGRHSEGKGDGERNLKDSRRDIMSAFADYKGGVFFVHGSKDPEGMPARDIFQAFCEGNGLDAEFKLIDGSNHNFHTAAWKREVIDSSVEWLLARGRTSE